MAGSPGERGSWPEGRTHLRRALLRVHLCEARGASTPLALRHDFRLGGGSTGPRVLRRNSRRRTEFLASNQREHLTG